MAIGAGSLIQVTIGGTMLANAWMNVWTFEVVGETGNPTAAEWGEAIWNDCKTNYRALVANVHTAAFQYVKVREMDSLTGEYGEFSIPSAEQVGTGGTSATTYLPTFTAAGIRLTVATRVTRPGQKRVPGQRAEDISTHNWQAAYLTKLGTFAANMVGMGVLGIPAVTSEVKLSIVSLDRVSGLPVAHQPVTGYLVNPLVTSQVSRKAGVGV